MGRLLAILLILQISIPGSCCFATRIVKCVAALADMGGSADRGVTFGSCCSQGCCNQQDGDVAPGKPPSERQSDDSPGEPNCCSEDGRSRPSKHESCGCLERDPFVLPAQVSIDLNFDAGLLVYSANVPSSRCTNWRVKAQHYAPPLRLHLFLCNIRC